MRPPLSSKIKTKMNWWADTSGRVPTLQELLCKFKVLSSNFSPSKKIGRKWF
jgi:hypothetical protein